jgi:1,4-alpha-glucan branching enzyme
MVRSLPPTDARIVLTTCREHDANDVYVTGTFDDWKKTVQLEKEDGVFKKTVELPKTKTQYKVCTHHDTRLSPSSAAGSARPDAC